MDESKLHVQARAIAALFPSLARQLFTADDAVAAELPLAQLRVCGILYGGPRSMTALGRELNVSLSAMTQIADRLERTRLVKRAAVGTDRRVRCLQLTARGEKFMLNRQTALVERVSTVLAQVPSAARDQVLSALEALMRACERANVEQPLAEHAG